MFSTNPHHLVLASSSPRRKELLESLGLRFVIDAPGVEEVGAEFGGGFQMVEENARRKAEAISARHPMGNILAADTTVCRDDRIFGKPSNMEEAEAMLAELQGTFHQVYTGVTFLAHGVGQRFHDVAVTTVWFRPLDTEAIRGYLSSIDPFDKAGGYAIQDGGDRIIERIEGSYSNVMGLPLEMVRPWFRTCSIL